MPAEGLSLLHGCTWHSVLLLAPPGFMGKLGGRVLEDPLCVPSSRSQVDSQPRPGSGPAQSCRSRKVQAPSRVLPWGSGPGWVATPQL